MDLVFDVYAHLFKRSQGALQTVEEDVIKPTKGWHA